LERLIRAYDRAATPYLSRPRPQFLGVSGDYDHLARLGEWSPYGGGR
jgi:ATP-dependent helicase/nuclease subunit B